MKSNKAYIGSFVSGMFLFILIIIPSSCVQDNYPIPDFQVAPEILEMEVLLNEYQADPLVAESKYAGKVYLFPAVKADAVVSRIINPRATFMEMFLQSGIIKFRPKFNDSLDPIGPGFIVDIIGEVQGWIEEAIYINDCLYMIVEGGNLPPPMGY